MIQRVNLLRKKGFQLTYGVLGLSVGITILLCLSIYGFQWFLQYRTKSQIQKLTVQIEQFKKEREKLLKKEDVVKGTGPYIEVQKILYKTPPWPAVLNNISLILPGDVWLEDTKSSDKKSGGKKQFTFKGEAKKAQSLAHFLKELDKTPYFDNVIVKSKEETGLFKFDITCDMSEGPWR